MERTGKTEERERVLIETHHYDTEKTKEVKSSYEWNNKHKIELISYDGWDRKNLAAAFWEEKITEEEFLKSVSESTIKFSL